MPSRLVYAPKVYAYTKAQNGATYNLSRYVVSGKVERKINQVSTAQITLRNPYKIFTGGQGQPRAFHPMDPITIYLERVQNHPVRVFTGYLDTTPYLQMYPGTISLSASCTLKKLLYSYFDPSLPYVIAFFEQYGWINTGKGSIISIPANQNTANQAAVDAGQKPFTDLQDGSLAKLLWAVLTDIGQWDDKQIYIENLPSGANGIAARVEALMKSIQTGQQEAQSDFTSFLQGVIGAGAQGSGGGAGATSSGPVKGGKEIVQTVEPIATKYNVPPEMVLAVMDIETTFSNQDSSGNPHYGWFQVQTANPPYAYGTWSHSPPSVSDAHDLGLACTAFCSAAAGWASAQPSLRNDIHQWAMSTQGVNCGNNPLYCSEWSSAVDKGKSLISQYGSATATTATNQLTNATDQPGATAPASNDGGGSLLANIFPTGTKGTLERTDMGVDFAFADGIKIGSIGAGTVSLTTSGGFDGQPLLMVKLDAPIGKYSAWYISEGIRPTKTSGHVNPGEQIAITEGHGTGLETGWADPNTGWPVADSYYKEGQMTPDGMAFAKAIGVPAISNTQPITVTGTGAAGAGVGSGGATGTTSNGTAQAFVTELNFPSIEDQVAAIALGAEHKGLMHDQPLMPFVQQIAQASLRSFQSLPDGSFYGFYPDYFGEFGHHKPYWQIDDLEVLSGGINLSDDSLATHVFAVGDNTWPANQELINMLFSSGAINIFNAFVGNGIIDTKSLNKKDKKKKKNNGLQSDGLDPGIIDAEEAVAFIQRYGARPLVQDYPTVRNPIFEMLLAYQQFMFAWSNQFKTPFTFTFMPELFPGGKVAFHNHGIMMYINSVTHEFNYSEGGFTTTAEMSAPSVLPGVDPADYDLPPLMVTALVEPIKQAKETSTASAQQEADKALTKLSSIVDSAVQAFSL